MIRVTVKRGLLGEIMESHSVEADGWTPQLLVDIARSKMPAGLGIMVAVDGVLLERDEQLHEPLRNGQHLIVLPQTTGETLLEILVYVLIQAVIAAAVSLLIRALTPTPKAPGVAQDRGDESSPTYAWDGIKTNYGAGLPIPWVYGEHDVGGQVIWTDVTASGTAQSSDDRLRIILALCEGPVARVAGSTGGNAQQIGSSFGGILVDGNLLLPAAIGDPPNAFGSVRLGNHDQAVLPPPFSGVSSAFNVNLDVTDVAKVFTFTGVDAAVQARIVIVCPSGLYQQGPSGTPQSVSRVVTVKVRRSGSTLTWTAPPTDIGAGGPFVGYHATTLVVPLDAIFPGGITDAEIEVGTSGPSGSTIAATTIWRDVSVQQSQTLRYPGEALLGLELIASARFSGGLPQIQVPVQGALVRVWDESTGWSAPGWSAASFQTYAAGRNPAWCLLDFLLARWGLGEYLTENDIDLPAFRRWSAFCDTDPNPANPWDEPAFEVALVGDRPRPAWEWVLAFCAAGRAAPILRAGKLSVVYQYRDEHGDAGITVPAKEPVQLLTSGNVESLSVRWPSHATLPTVFLFQYLNQDNSYQQDVLPVEDPDGTMNDPTAVHTDDYRPETIQAYSVTRGQQLYREGIWRHRIGRQVLREISFVAGPWTLACEVGDLFEFEHELLRPFGDDVAVSAMLTHVEDNTNVVIDHDPGTATHIVVRSTDGSSRIATIGMTFPQGVNGWPIILDDPGVANVEGGATVVLGVADKLVETYQVIAITLRQDLKREVRAIQWTPDAYDPVSKSEWESAARAIGFEVVDPPADLGDPPPATVGVSLTREAQHHRIAWVRPHGMQGRSCSVHVRLAGAATWNLLTTTDATSILTQLRPHVAHEVSICWPNSNSGAHVQPDDGDRFTFVAPEFPETAPPALTKARAVLLDDAVLVQADELQSPDLECYELAVGSSWAARRILARERFPRFHLQVPAGPPLLVTAKSVSGLHGPVVVVANPNWVPPDLVDELDEDDLDPSPAGSHDGTEWASGVLRLQDGVLTGVYTSAEYDLSYQAPRFFQVRTDQREVHHVPIGDLQFAIGSGEAHWRTIEGRPASSGMPGLDWQTRISDLHMPIDDLPNSLRVGGQVGEVGTHTRIAVESRFYTDGAWTAWREHVDRTVLASRLQVRIAINRRSVAYTASVHLLSYHAFL